MEQDLGPDEALALARQTRSKLVQRAASPWWYAPGYGLGCGGLVASLALPGWYALLGAVGSLLFAVVLYLVWSRRSGLSVSGYRRGRTRPVTIAFLVAYVVAFGVALAWRDSWVPLAAGAVLAMVAAAASLAWDRAWRADIADGV